MTKRTFYLFAFTVISCNLFADARTGSLNSRNLLLKSASTKNLVETAVNHQWSVNFPKHGNDSLMIVAIRVEFQRNDSSSLTTGNGRFGMLYGYNSRNEQKFYIDGTYKFDALPHNYYYFENQLTALKNYYSKVSRGKLTLDFSIYPSASSKDIDAGSGYQVPHNMTSYSPGWKKKEEKSDEYWDRKTKGLITFVRDALLTASNKSLDSPFQNLYQDKDGILRDAKTGKKAVILILHAGASYLTDGGMEEAANTPSDMIDAFINQEYFKYFKDTLELDTSGVTVMGRDGPIVIDEVMMCSETSNQDGLNWGIQGILVNQMARQLGIPDLFSTSSGTTAIGAFCIMDFAGYSAGQGFIPPYPSAWVRAFMGWDTPRVISAGSSYNVKALCAALDLQKDNDTTIFLVPINNNEYYLIENRQRNLSSDKSLFEYTGNSQRIIKAYPFNVSLSKNVKSSSNSVITEARNNDISLPASGALVWHVDERVIRQRLAHNFVNADSSYRGVRLVEADGVNVLGVEYTDMFYQAAFDYGGANHVFPHTTVSGNKKSKTINSMGPYTRPSTRSNDGGHTYLTITTGLRSVSPREERTLSFQNDTIINYSDSIFKIDIKYDYLKQGWPRRAAPENFFDPLVTAINVSPSAKDTVFALLSESGRFYLFSVDGSKQESYGNRKAVVNFADYEGKIAYNDTVIYLDSIDAAFTFPTAIGNRIFIPSKKSGLHIYNFADLSDKKVVPLPAAPSSYICGIGEENWALGLADGRIIKGLGDNITDTVKLSNKSPVCAVALLQDKDNPAAVFAAVQENGDLYIISDKKTSFIKVRNGKKPYTIVTGDLDGDGKSEIIVSDSRQGLWVYTRDSKDNISLAPGWNEKPNDWANEYHIDPQNRKGRSWYPKNFSAPAVADINRDGSLDIVVSGTNGIYALNRRGALLSRWPAYLDNRYWYQRGSVTSSPVIVSHGNSDPLVLFSSPTGENATFTITKIVTADKERGVITFKRDNGTLDSLWDISASTIDTILTLGDSLIYPYVLPGGFVDALSSDAKRPVEQIGSWAVPQSRWPLSAGAPITTSPVIYQSSQTGVPDLFAVASDGMIYRWQLTGILSNSLYWPQNGFDAGRSFAYGGPLTKPEDITNIKDPLEFWNYPNPTSGESHTTFKYRFRAPAKNVRLDIYTITGYRMDTFTGLSGSFPDWNEFKVNLKKYGPGIYRCRMEAHVDGKKYSRMWKMAVVK
ncbi:MAG: FG-GAP-like repeat-containing protein [Chitinispirillales bacterium]|jgi:hypothetical protein|nr:FG-GAP-like repeat-containing protein [Chitinispirillales bacterium]